MIGELSNYNGMVHASELLGHISCLHCPIYGRVTALFLLRFSGLLGHDTPSTSLLSCHQIPTGEQGFLVLIQHSATISTCFWQPYHHHMTHHLMRPP